MKVFLMSVAAAIILAAVGIFALNELQKPAGIAYTSPTSVRL